MKDRRAGALRRMGVSCVGCALSAALPGRAGQPAGPEDAGPLEGEEGEAAELDEAEPTP